MREVQLTITYKFLERAIFIIIILLLLFLLIGKYTSEDCDCADSDQMGDAEITTTSPPPAPDEDSGADTAPEPGEDASPPPEPEPEEEPEPESSGELSGGVEVELGLINWEIQNDSRARINNIKISITNGLDEDVKLFATIWVTQSGNDDLESYNPVWEDADLPLVASGETKLITLEAQKSWPPGLEDGDNVLIDAEFENFQGDISVSDSTSQRI